MLCAYSDLLPTECAHCLGHKGDWEIDPPKVVIYE